MTDAVVAKDFDVEVREFDGNILEVMERKLLIIFG
jgi:hypothetical protein